jgi:radical SAM superfamily enzyme YgiQ (UPF0313 family)
MAGFIIGFDGEVKGAGDRIVRFVEDTTVPMAMFSMLQALPDTALWHRLNKEGRLREANSGMNQTTLMNFVPTRPLEDIAQEYVDAFWRLYDPMAYLDRTYRHFLILGAPRSKGGRRQVTKSNLKALFTLVWRQGIVRETRWKFWHHLVGILWHNPKVWEHYLGILALGEHFLEYRSIVRDQIQAQMSQQPKSEVFVLTPKTKAAA